MDCGNDYIKMRIEAIPDLGRGTPYLDAFYATPDLKSFIDRKGDWYVWTEGEPNWCQLERQDQSQEMVRGKYPALKELVYRFSLWSMFYASKFTSMEQLWLAFYMGEFHNKIWEGKWVEDIKAR